MADKHTPGPWDVTDDGRDDGRLTICTRDEDVALVKSKDNAHLIAAAPELLAILSRILYAHDTKNCGAAMGEAILCPAYAAAARDAIAKAEGR